MMMMIELSSTSRFHSRITWHAMINLSFFFGLPCIVLGAFTSILNPYLVFSVWPSVI